MWQDNPPNGSWKTRVYHDDGRTMVFGLGTDREIAQHCENLLFFIRKQRKWAWLDLLFTRRVKIQKAYDAQVNERLAQYFEDAIAEAHDVDLDPLVREWAAEGADPKYVRQVRRMIGEGKRFPLSKFRRKYIAKWIKTLDPQARTEKLSTETRLRYKAALSSFAEFLIEREYLEGNPVHGISLSKTREEKSSDEGVVGKEAIHLHPSEVRGLVKAIHAERPLYGVMEALMAGSGMEKQAVLRTRVEDVDFNNRMVYARGSKRGARTRWVEVTEGWAWNLIAEHAGRTAEYWARDARIFPEDGIDEKDWLEVHHACATKLGLRFTTPHNHRHSFAVMWIKRGATGGLRRDGRDTQWLKNQLGHEPKSNQLFVTYGVYIGKAQLAAKSKRKVTSTVTSG